MTAGDATWPNHDRATVPWSQTARAGTRDDRTLREITVSLPPKIAGRTVDLSSDLAAEVEEAMRAITTLDATHGRDLGPLGLLLVRTESVASSKIERIEASLDDYARALHGHRSNISAVSMVAGTDALGAMVESVGRTRTIRDATIRTAHEALMRDDPYEQDQAGRYRTVQNWIGGSDHSPRGALYVPPPPDTVKGSMADLVTFANGDAMPALAQAAIAHAQFESIHPFTDGNGRIGRALVNAILRRRGATTSVVIPIASALVAHRERYFAVLGDYRAGDPFPIISAFARAAKLAATESAVTAERLTALPTELRELAGHPRSGSAAAKILDHLPTSPIVSADDLINALDASESAIYRALAHLETSEILRPLTTRKRNQIWAAAPILTELEDLGTRIEAAAR